MNLPWRLSHILGSCSGYGGLWISHSLWKKQYEAYHATFHSSSSPNHLSSTSYLIQTWRLVRFRVLVLGEAQILWLVGTLRWRLDIWKRSGRSLRNDNQRIAFTPVRTELSFEARSSRLESIAPTSIIAKYQTQKFSWRVTVIVLREFQFEGFQRNRDIHSLEAWTCLALHPTFHQKLRRLLKEHWMPSTLQWGRKRSRGQCDLWKCSRQRRICAYRICRGHNWWTSDVYETS